MCTRCVYLVQNQTQFKLDAIFFFFPGVDLVVKFLAEFLRENKMSLITS